MKTYPQLASVALCAALVCGCSYQRLILLSRPDGSVASEVDIGAAVAVVAQVAHDSHFKPDSNVDLYKQLSAERDSWPYRMVVGYVRSDHESNYEEIRLSVWIRKSTGQIVVMISDRGLGLNRELTSKLEQTLRTGLTERLPAQRIKVERLWNPEL